MKRGTDHQKNNSIIRHNGGDILSGYPLEETESRREQLKNIIMRDHDIVNMSVYYVVQFVIIVLFGAASYIMIKQNNLDGYLFAGLSVFWFIVFTVAQLWNYRSYKSFKENADSGTVRFYGYKVNNKYRNEVSGKTMCFLRLDDFTVTVDGYAYNCIDVGERIEAAVIYYRDNAYFYLLV